MKTLFPISPHILENIRYQVEMEKYFAIELPWLSCFIDEWIINIVCMNDHNREQYNMPNNFSLVSFAYSIQYPLQFAWNSI